MKVIKLISSLTDEYISSLSGRKLDESYFDLLVDEDTDIYKPNGDPLIKFRKSVVNPTLCAEAYLALRSVPEQFSNTNRGMAAGIDLAANMTNIEGRPIGARKGRTCVQAIRQDGRLSKTLYSPAAPSGIAGYFERVSRYPYCRQTAFPMKQAAKWSKALPFIRAVSEVFGRFEPSRYANQLAMIEKTNSDFYIHQTVFTTITVNKNWQTALHTDSGDLKTGFGVMAVLSNGKYDGCYFCFPKYRIAVNMRHTDVLLADVHEWHCNTPFKDCIEGGYERVSVVFYYRAKMHECGNASEELDKTKNRKRGTPLHGG